VSSSAKRSSSACCDVKGFWAGTELTGILVIEPLSNHHEFPRFVASEAIFIIAKDVGVAYQLRSQMIHLQLDKNNTGLVYDNCCCSIGLQMKNLN
jgi:hypothetical protein